MQAEVPFVLKELRSSLLSYPATGNDLEEVFMPVILLWAVPAIVVLGGGIYLIGHMH